MKNYALDAEDKNQAKVEMEKDWFSSNELI